MGGGAASAASVTFEKGDLQSSDSPTCCLDTCLSVSPMAVWADERQHKSPQATAPARGP